MELLYVESNYQIKQKAHAWYSPLGNTELKIWKKVLYSVDRTLFWRRGKTKKEIGCHDDLRHLKNLVLGLRHPTFKVLRRNLF